MPAGHRYKLTVLGRYPARLKGNQTAVTANLAAGDHGGHLVHCGTITMSESEWDTLIAALESGLGDHLEVEDVDRPKS